MTSATGPWRPATRAIHLGRPAAEPDAALNEPLTPATAFRAGGDLGYAREGNPGWVALEDAIGDLEGGHAVALSSGIAAVDLIVDLLGDRVGSGAVVLTQNVAYSGTLRRLEHHHAAGRLQLRNGSPENIAEQAATADLIWLETPANPTLELTDIAAVASRRRPDALLIVDNTVATPLLQRPLDLGADLVVHSASKYIAGHSDALLGLVVAQTPELAGRVRQGRTGAGCVPGVLEAFLGLRGLRTMPMRLERAGANAAELARRLAADPGVAEVYYPGLPEDPGHSLARRQMTGDIALLAWRPFGGADRAERICRSTELWIHATSLGGVESTLERRRRWGFESAAVPEDLIRLSVGCEDVEDLWADLLAALGATAG